MSSPLNENHRGSPVLTLLNELVVLGVLIALNVFTMLSELNVLNMPMDPSLACWAMFPILLLSVLPFHRFVYCNGSGCIRICIISLVVVEVMVVVVVVVTLIHYEAC